jgi:hypothetical protein
VESISTYALAYFKRVEVWCRWEVDLATVFTVMIFKARTEFLVESLGFCALLGRVGVVKNWMQVGV